MYAAECVICHGKFQSKRDTARYCSDRCRKRRQRAGVSLDQLDSLPQRREGAPVIALSPPPKGEDEDSFAAGTRRDLEAADRLDTYLGRSAMHLARVVDANVGDTGSGHAALIKQYIVAMEAALDGVQVTQSAAERLRARHAKRAGAA